MSVLPGQVGGKPSISAMKLRQAYRPAWEMWAPQIQNSFPGLGPTTVQVLSTFFILAVGPNGSCHSRCYWDWMLSFIYDPLETSGTMSPNQPSLLCAFLVFYHSNERLTSTDSPKMSHCLSANFPKSEKWSLPAHLWFQAFQPVLEFEGWRAGFYRTCMLSSKGFLWLKCSLPASNDLYCQLQMNQPGKGAE